MKKIFGVRLLALLALLFASVHSHRFVPFDKMSIQELEDWVRPPNRQVYQQLLLDRMLRNMDPTVDPCEDFYQFACGNYDAVRPQNFRTIGVSLLAEVLLLTVKLRNNLILATGENHAREDERKVWNFYRSCMDIHRDTYTPRDFVQSFGSWPAFDNYWRPENFDWMQQMVELMKVGVDCFFFLHADAQVKGKEYGDTVNHLILPSRFILQKINQRELYKKLGTFFNMHVSESYIEDMSHRISTFHNQLIQLIPTTSDTTREEFFIHELNQVVPSCHMTRLITLLISEDPNPTDTVKIIPKFTERICALVERTDKRTIADTMLYHLYDYAQTELSFMKSLNNKNLQEHCFENTTQLLQPILANMFVEKYVRNESWQEVVELMKNLRQVGVEMMTSETEWLDETTRRRAIKKMDGISSNIIYPYSRKVPDTTLAKVDIEATSFLQNVRRLKGVQLTEGWRLQGKHAGLIKFDTLTVNPSMMNQYRGQIRIQAATLQPPYYSIFSPSFHTFGSTLTVFGHETMHAFDVELGITWDEFGHDNPLISPSRQLVHHMRSSCFYEQFENFNISGTDMHVKGALTMAENVADNDGLKMAFKLFKRWMTENRDKVWQEEFTFAPLQLSHEQAFFLSYGQTWCDYRIFDNLVYQINADEHSPGKFRIIGGVSNSRDFARAFNCPVNSKMNPLKKCNYFFD